MKRNLNYFLMALVSILALSLCAIAQETTGSIEVTIKDTTGAVVPNVPLTVKSAGTSTGYRRTVTTNDEGVVRLVQVPHPELTV